MQDRLRAVLFDLDGTLLDTAPDMVGALNALRKELKFGPLPYEPLRSLVSHGAARLIAAGFPDADGESRIALQNRYLDLYGAALSRETRLFDGMDGVLSRLAELGLASGIVTNKPARYTDALLAQLDLTRRFACVVSGDSVAECKPHPLPLLHAAKIAGAAARQCIYVGDAQRDMQAAHAAGMTGLVATYGYLQEGEPWQSWGGDGAIDSPAELLSWLERSDRL